MSGRSVLIKELIAANSAFVRTTGRDKLALATDLIVLPSFSTESRTSEGGSLRMNTGPKKSLESLAEKYASPITSSKPKWQSVSGMNMSF